MSSCWFAVHDSSQIISADSAPRAAVHRTTAADSNASQSNAQSEVAFTLEVWASALARGDLNSHMSYYADELNPYLLTKHTVSKAAVRAEKSRLLATDTLVTVDLDEFQIQSPPRWATARFRKTWETRDGEHHITRHQTWSQVRLERLEGGWVITSEQDLPVPRSSAATTRTPHGRRSTLSLLR